MDNVVFLKVDVDEAEDVAAEYNISAMPTFVFLKDGKKVRAHVHGTAWQSVDAFPLNEGYTQYVGYGKG